MATTGKRKSSLVILAVGGVTAGCLINRQYAVNGQEVDVSCLDDGDDGDTRIGKIDRRLTLTGISIPDANWGVEDWEDAQDAGTILAITWGTAVIGDRVRTFNANVLQFSEDSNFGDYDRFTVQLAVIGSVTLPVNT